MCTSLTGVCRCVLVLQVYVDAICVQNCGRGRIQKLSVVYVHLLQSNVLDATIIGQVIGEGMYCSL